MSHCNNGLNNHLVNNLIETKVAKETGDLKYLQDSMREFIAALSDLITGKYSDHFLEEYVGNLFTDYQDTLEESLKIPQLKEEVTLALQRLSAQDKTVKQHTTQLTQLFGDVSKLENANLVLESVAELSSINNPVDGMRVYVKSYHSGLRKGGGYFVYDSLKSSVNDGGTVIDGWVREDVKVVYPEFFGARGDGVTNDRESLQKALDAVGDLYFKDVVYVLDSSGLDVRSNQRLNLGKATLKLLSHNTANYQILRLWDVSNSEIYGGTLDGSKELNQVSGGEWGMAISLRGTNDISITDTKTLNCWGDGIYIGSTTTQNFCKNTFINGVKSIGHRRQGMSVISVKTLQVNQMYIADIGGTNPQAGIDFEPNNPDEFLSDIQLSNLTFKNITNSAIAFIPIKLSNTDVGINITNIVAENVGNIVSGSIFRSGLSITGRILVSNVIGTNIGGLVSLRSYSSDGPLITITNSSIHNANRNSHSSSITGALITVQALAGDAVDYPVGNLIVDGLVYTSSNVYGATKLVALRSFSESSHIEKVYVRNINKISVDGVATNKSMNSFVLDSKDIEIKDTNFAYAADITASTYTLVPSNFCPTLRGMAGSSVVIISELFFTHGVGLSFTVIAEEKAIRVRPPSGYNFLGYEVDQELRSAETGCELTVKVLSGNRLQIERMIGKWTAYPEASLPEDTTPDVSP